MEDRIYLALGKTVVEWAIGIFGLCVGIIVLGKVVKLIPDDQKLKLPPSP